MSTAQNVAGAEKETLEHSSRIVELASGEATMAPFVFWVLAACAQKPGADVDAAQFLRLIKGLHSEIRDVTFVFEGGTTPHDSGGVNPAKPSMYQGLYSFRSDGATLLDVFSRSPDMGKPGMRAIDVILKGNHSRISQVPDLGISQPQNGKGAPGVLNGPASAERILYLWYLQTMADPALFGYEFQGWETVDGHRCLRVQFNQVPREQVATWPGDLPIVRFWIDMERGGHPLKVEFWNGTKLFMRSDKIKLARLSIADGKAVWFPIRGETNSFNGPDKAGRDSYRDSPFFTETYAVVNRSVRINQGLTDDYFTVKRKDAMPDIGDLRRMQRELNSEPVARLRTDPRGVQERLDLKLAEAERQAKQLEASSAARAAWDWTLILQLVFGVVGISLVCGALLWRWRSR
jgi:hypothetical protein